MRLASPQKQQPAIHRKIGTARRRPPQHRPDKSKSNGRLNFLTPEAHLFSFPNTSATPTPGIQIRRSAGSSKQGIGSKDPKRSLVQLPLFLRRVFSSLCSHLPLSAEPPLHHIAFLFRGTLQVFTLIVIHLLVDVCNITFSIYACCIDSVFLLLLNFHEFLLRNTNKTRLSCFVRFHWFKHFAPSILCSSCVLLH